METVIIRKRQDKRYRGLDYKLLRRTTFNENTYGDKPSWNVSYKRKSD